MKRQAYNPYLPAWEYIPDGEPRVFGDRLYIFGSHDRFGAEGYCENDYVAWSAPVEDLSDWRYEGVISGKTRHRGIHVIRYIMLRIVCRDRMGGIISITL